MNPKDLVAHKRVPKFMDAPTFKKLIRKNLPKPFNRMGRSGSQATDLIAVSDNHRVIFIWHDGPERNDRSFYGYLLCVGRNDDLHPLFELHYHPSHKGLHCKTPCNSDLNYRNRLLPGGRELNLERGRDFDPRSERDRAELIEIFCKATGVETSKIFNRQAELWN